MSSFIIKFDTYSESFTMTFSKLQDVIPESFGNAPDVLKRAIQANNQNIENFDEELGEIAKTVTSNV